MSSKIVEFPTGPRPDPPSGGPPGTPPSGPDFYVLGKRISKICNDLYDFSDMLAGYRAWFALVLDRERTAGNPVDPSWLAMYELIQDLRIRLMALQVDVMNVLKQEVLHGVDAAGKRVD